MKIAWLMEEAVCLLLQVTGALLNSPRKIFESVKMVPAKKLKSFAKAQKKIGTVQLLWKSRTEMLCDVFMGFCVMTIHRPSLYCLKEEWSHAAGQQYEYEYVWIV